LRHHYIDRHELSECLSIQDRMGLMGGSRLIGEVLSDQSYLEQNHVRAILMRQKIHRPADIEISRFGFLAKTNGFVNDREIQRALDLQRRFEKERKMRLHLGEMLVVQGIISVAERKAILMCQQRVRMEDEVAPSDRPAHPQELLLELERMERRGGIRGTLIVVFLILAAAVSVAAMVAVALPKNP